MTLTQLLLQQSSASFANSQLFTVTAKPNSPFVCMQWLIQMLINFN